MTKHEFVYTLLMLVVCTGCKQQNKNELQADNIKIEIVGIITSQVPNRITRTIIQDRNGNIWFAAFDGVYKYDGKSFTNLTSRISSSRFFSVLEDRKGNFWFGSFGDGVYYYDGKSFRNFTMKEGLPDNNIICMYEDKNGRIWFGTNVGVSCYDGKSFRNFTTADGLPNNEVNAIMEDKKGNFWFGTRGAACVYNGKAFSILTNKISVSPMNNYGKSLSAIRTIIQDKKANVWLSSGTSGLWCYHDSAFTNVSQKGVGFFIQDKKGSIWTTSESDDGSGWALSRYDEESLFTKKITIAETNASTKMIFTIFEDRDGNIWFGSNGVYRYNGNEIEDFSGGEKYSAIFRSSSNCGN